MKIITHEDIVKLNIGSEVCYQWMIEALKIKDDVYLHEK